MTSRSGTSRSALAKAKKAAGLPVSDPHAVYKAKQKARKAAGLLARLGLLEEEAFAFFKRGSQGGFAAWLMEERGLKLTPGQARAGGAFIAGMEDGMKGVPAFTFDHVRP
jgi:hypothetical protein